MTCFIYCQFCCLQVGAITVTFGFGHNPHKQAFLTSQGFITAWTNQLACHHSSVIFLCTSHLQADCFTYFNVFNDNIHPTLPIAVQTTTRMPALTVVHHLFHAELPHIHDSTTVYDTEYNAGTNHGNVQCPLPQTLAVCEHAIWGETTTMFINTFSQCMLLCHTVLSTIHFNDLYVLLLPYVMFATF